MAPQSSSQAARLVGELRTCFCEERPVLRTSSTVENPGRRFWGCVNYRVNLLFAVSCFEIALSAKQIGEECDYFAWAEAEGQDPQIQRLKKKATMLKENLQKTERKFALALAIEILGWITARLLLYDRFN
ncbi:hypothetical protein Ahy_B05g078305 [Arachis hypogaea]|uniref:GRF-type domain-containing protein n=1 Tax=Arachis hypogaea TaxID=3818 RepID=A0A444Z6U0_ARAHY|nr:hypothetical protein Ahy_B05g078305 [Arachis hypogaea]